MTRSNLLPPQIMPQATCIKVQPARKQPTLVNETAFHQSTFGFDHTGEATARAYALQQTNQKWTNAHAKTCNEATTRALQQPNTKWPDSHPTSTSAATPTGHSGKTSVVGTTIGINSACSATSKTTSYGDTCTNDTPDVLHPPVRQCWTEASMFNVPDYSQNATKSGYETNPKSMYLDASPQLDHVDTKEPPMLAVIPTKKTTSRKCPIIHVCLIVALVLASLVGLYYLITLSVTATRNALQSLAPQIAPAIVNVLPIPVIPAHSECKIQTTQDECSTQHDCSRTVCEDLYLPVCYCGNSPRHSNIICPTRVIDDTLGDTVDDIDSVAVDATESEIVGDTVGEVQNEAVGDDREELEAVETEAVETEDDLEELHLYFGSDASGYVDTRGSPHYEDDESVHISSQCCCEEQA